MKKFISLGVVSAMVASLASAVMAAAPISTETPNTVWALRNDSKTLGNALVSKASVTSKNGTAISNAYEIVGNNTDTVKLVFGASNSTTVATKNTHMVGKTTAAPTGYQVIPVTTSTNDYKYSKEGSITNSGTISIKKVSNVTINDSIHGDYKYAYGFEINFNNKTKNETYAAWNVIINGNTFKIAARCTGNDLDDTGVADGDVNENGVVEFNSGAIVRNGYVISAKQLEAMYNLGSTYGIKMSNGVSVIPSKVLKATYQAGNMTLNYNISKDASLVDRYEDVAGGKPVTLDVVSGFVNEKVKYNIEVGHDDVLKTITDSQSDRWSDGKKVYVYVVNKANLETAASASATDGIINSERMIVGSIKDGQIVFEVPAKYFDNSKEKLMVTLKELDVAKLPVVSGVSLDTSDVANEVVAPVISDASDAVIDAPVIEAPASTTGKATADTGASDMVALAAVIAAISMAAAGTVAFKKF